MNNTYTLLIVEDDKFLSNALEAKLTREAFNLRVAHNGEDALRIALESHPDLILLDVLLPKMDGITMLQRLREDAWGKDVPVLLLTNLNDAKMIEESIKHNVHDYLIKSDWSLQEVVARIREKLNIQTS